jgi:hypothetical protein
MSAEDWIDELLYADDDYHGQDPEEQEVQCNRCGARWLHWRPIVKADGAPGWGLFTHNGRRHLCANNQPNPDDFGVIEE